MKLIQYSINSVLEDISFSLKNVFIIYYCVAYN